MDTTDSYDARERLLSRAASFLASEHYHRTVTGNPNEDAEMEYAEDGLLEAAREFVKAYEDHETMLTAEGKLAVMMRVVELDGDGYSVPQGSIGIVDHQIDDDHYWINWMGPQYDEENKVVESRVPTPGGSSGPIHVDALEPLGQFFFSFRK